MSATSGPRVVRNDWSTLARAPLGAWTPRKTVSIVVPAFEAHDTLPCTLASLSAQTYPSDLLEVIVVDDGSTPSLTLPELRPEHTRIVRATDSWGRANACREGAALGEGEVIHWLDADMVLCRDSVEAQMRWHHAIDHAVVLGHKRFVDDTDLPEADDVRAAVASDSLEELFAGRWTDRHCWVEQIWERTADLTQAGFRAFHVHVGATASIGRDLYESSGGMDPTMKLGEDIELGYRLTMKGGVFIADAEARGWHLGRTTVMQREEQVQRYNLPFLAERVPDLRRMRQKRGRTYRVPLVEVVVDSAGHSYEEVKYTVEGVLQGVPGDVRCVILGDWQALHDARRHPLDDDLLDHRLLREEYASESRVSFAETLSPTAFPAMFRLHLPTGWRPVQALGAVTREMQQHQHGLRSVLLPDGRVARFEFTAAYERARRVRRPDEDVDDVVDAISGSWWSEGAELGFTHVTDAPAPPAHRPQDSSNGSAGPTMATPVPPAGHPRLRAAARRLGITRLRDSMRTSQGHTAQPGSTGSRP
jgi:glycosyltransferase involved in cell wall biosynthesis